MTTPPELPLPVVQSRIDPEIWARRVAAADEEATLLADVLERVRAGESRRSALAAVVPDQPHGTMLARLRRFEQGGRDALIDRRAPKAKERKVTAEVKGAVRALAHGRPELGSEALADELEAAIGVRLGGSTMRELLAELGLARGRGRPAGSGSGPLSEADDALAEITFLPLAGAELLKATEDEVGAVRALTMALGDFLSQLPEPSGDVLDDTGHRDDRGRFLAPYNAPKSRTEPELGGTFDTVERRRGEKDLRAMRVANSSFEARYRKDLALTLLPVLLESPRWSGLGHWQGAHLETLVGHAYMPATLDKHARELKLSGAVDAAREATAEFWIGQDGMSDSGGAVVVYIDGSTKPVWTHHFTRCTKISSNGRVMPGMTTVCLNSGTGTPLVYRTFSGHASVPKEAIGLLQQVDAATGGGTTARLVVLDRESHAIWLFKELHAGGWQYIVPLRQPVTGPKARFEGVGEWVPHGTTGDETCDGWLWLNDSRAGEDKLRVRVVGRKRHRTGKVAWYATNAGRDQFGPSAILDFYFARWPLQEHVFRAGNGRVGLDVQHGYGRKKVTNVAVVTEIEKLETRLARCDEQRPAELAARDALVEAHAEWALVEAELGEMMASVVAEMDLRVAAQDTGPEFVECYADLRRHQRWLDEARAESRRLRVELDDANGRIEALDARIEKLRSDRDRRASQTTIFTVDTELDEIMTAYKVTFMNLATRLCHDHMGERMELDTLIRSVLTLPGERVVAASTETIRIYRQPRDPRAMAAVERACASLNALGLSRGPDDEPRRLTLELVDHPGKPVAPGSA